MAQQIGLGGPAVAQPQTTFEAALPYGILTLAGAVIGVVTALAFSHSMVALVAGIVIAFVSAYMFFGVLIAGITLAGNPKEFNDNIGKILLTSAGTGLGQLMLRVADHLIPVLINHCLNRR